MTFQDIEKLRNGLDVEEQLSQGLTDIDDLADPDAAQREEESRRSNEFWDAYLKSDEFKRRSAEADARPPIDPKF